MGQNPAVGTDVFLMPTGWMQHEQDSILMRKILTSNRQDKKRNILGFESFGKQIGWAGVLNKYDELGHPHCPVRRSEEQGA